MNKILFWMDMDFMHFGIAKFLKDAYPCQLYALIDLQEKPMKFFLSQNITKFEDYWFYSDFVKVHNKTPDMVYLKEFEKKYNINLWKIIYSERWFYKYNKFYQFSKEEILNIIEQECKFFEKKLDEIKPDFLAIKTTDVHNGELLRLICKSKGIKILMLCSTNLKNRWAIAENVHEFYENNLKKEEINCKSFPELRTYLDDLSKKEFVTEVKQTVDIHKKTPMLNWFLQFAIKGDGYTNSDTFRFYGETKFKKLQNALFLFFRKRKREKYINKNFLQAFTNKKIVFYPLHLEPERILLINSPYYNNQIEVITNIAKSLPIGYELYVKEHPLMGIHSWRKISFYQEIEKLPNVQLIHPSFDTQKILEKCDLVVSIIGSTALESIFYEKPAIIFAHTSFSDLPCIFQIKKIHELPNIIKIALREKVRLNDVTLFLSNILNNTFEFNNLEISNDFNNTFYFSNTVTNTEISEHKMNQFLERHSTKFSDLVNEHIKIIKLIEHP